MERFDVLWLSLACWGSNRFTNYIYVSIPLPSSCLHRSLSLSRFQVSLLDMSETCLSSFISLQLKGSHISSASLSLSFVKAFISKPSSREEKVHLFGFCHNHKLAPSLKLILLQTDANSALELINKIAPSLSSSPLSLFLHLSSLSIDIACKQMNIITTA